MIYNMTVYGAKIGTDDFVELINFPKAGMIHEWFDHIGFERNGNLLESSEAVTVTTDDLQKLAEACKEVLDDHSKAKDLLPNSTRLGGFTEYGDSYFANVRDTMEKVTKILSMPDIGEYYMEYECMWLKFFTRG